MRRSGDVVTLDYTEVAYINQSLSTRTENVNPLAVITWIGGVELNPNSDVWLNERRLDSNVVDIDAGFTQAMQQLDVDPNTGFAPIQWGGWEETWSSRNVETNEVGRNSQNIEIARGRPRRTRVNGRRALVTPITEMQITSTTNEETVTIDRGLTRSGIQFQVNESIDTQSFGVIYLLTS